MPKTSDREAGSAVLRLDDRRELVMRQEALPLAQALNSQGVRRDVDEHGSQVDPGDQAALDRGPHGDAQVGIDFGVDWLAELLLEEAMDHGRAAGSADEDHAVDLLGGELGVGERSSTQTRVLFSRGSMSGS